VRPHGRRARASWRLGNGGPSRWCPDLTTMRFQRGTAPSNPLGGPAAQEIARYASHGSERNRSGVLAKEIGRPNVDLGNHAIDNLARNLDWLDTRRPDPVALGRRDFYLFFGFAQWCGRFCGTVGGIQNLRLMANYASVCSPSPKSLKGFERSFRTRTMINRFDHRH
jgi:hypothetical protein